jgi:hypothetical protein
VIDHRPLDDRGSFAWLAGEGDALSRGSAALVLDAGVLVVDPVDVPGLDGLLASAGHVIGVVTLFQRHERDAEQLAGRLAVPRLTPRALGGAGLGVQDVEERAVMTRRGWSEALLWLPGRRLLFCPETLGTAPFYLASPGDRLGMHPFARLFAPRAAFAGLEPAAMAFGHGPPLTDGSPDAMHQVLRTARSRLPRHWARLVPAAVRASRAARRVRRKVA